jgi:hypothetical protein
MNPIVYIVSIVELVIVATLITIDRIVAKLQIGKRERRRVELATLRAERELHRIASDAFTSMVEEARVSKTGSKSTSTDQLIDRQI